MDIETTLANLRRLVAALQSQVNDGVPDWDDMGELVTQFENFDSWMCNGGFLPTDWHPVRTLTVSDDTEINFGGLR